MYEVEWCADCPVDECGDAVIDNADYRQKYFSTRKQADIYARQIAPLDWFGAVKITECHRELYEHGLPGSYIEYDSEPEYVEP